MSIQDEIVLNQGHPEAGSGRTPYDDPNWDDNWYYRQLNELAEIIHDGQQEGLNRIEIAQNILKKFNLGTWIKINFTKENEMKLTLETECHIQQVVVTDDGIKKSHILKHKNFSNDFDKNSKIIDIMEKSLKDIEAVLNEGE